jgi:VWFA-related protein
VLVTDRAGKPIAGLEPTEFKIVDNDQPRKVLGFRRTDGTTGSKVDPPIELIIVLDAVNMPYQAVTLLRLQVEKFLRQNDGHLSQPTSVFMFTSDGLRIQPQPSKDGNALAAMLDQSSGTVRSMGSAAGSIGQGEQFNVSTQTLRGIADNEARKPGRKMVVWIGSGWPLLVGRQFVASNEGKARYFASIVDMLRKLREARITLYDVYTLNAADDKMLYQAFLKGVKAPKQADAGNLSLQVLATQTGGRVLDPSNDIAKQIATCLNDVGPYYTVMFEAPATVQANEYHELKVEVDQSGLGARTYSGYYDQP